MSTIELQESQAVPLDLPSELLTLETSRGRIHFHVIAHVVHGVKVNIKTEVSGSGGGWWYAGTGMSGMSVSSESKRVREFWLSPTTGGKDSYFEMIDSDFHVADGQQVIGLYAQVENTPSDLFALINVSSGTALKIGGPAAADLHQKYCSALIGKPTTLVGGLSLALMALGGFVWFKTNWMVGVPTLIGLMVVLDVVVKKVPMLSMKMKNEEDRKKLEKKIKERLYLCLKAVDNKLNPQWV